MLNFSLSGGTEIGEALQQHLEGIQQAPTLRVGFLESETYPDGTPVAQVAYWNEFGTSRAPMRSFFRPTILQKQKGWGVLLTTLLQRGAEVEQAMGLLGERIKDDITTAIVDFANPPNAPSTAARKGFGKNKPLIDTGQMQRAVAWELEQ